MEFEIYSQSSSDSTFYTLPLSNISNTNSSLLLNFNSTYNMSSLNTDVSMLKIVAVSQLSMTEEKYRENELATINMLMYLKNMTKDLNGTGPAGEVLAIMTKGKRMNEV